MTEQDRPRSIGFFTLLWAGYFISTLGSGLVGFALGVTVFQDTGSVSRYTMIGLSSLLPSILLSPIAGVLADRIDRRLILIGSGIGAAVTNYFLYQLTLEDPLNVWKLYGLILLTGCFNAFVWPTFSAVTTLLVSKQHLGRASGLTQIGTSVTAIVAPTLAAVLLVWVKLPGIVLLNLVSYLVPTAILLLVRLPQPKVSDEGAKAKGSFFQEAMSGWQFIAARPGLLLLLCSFATVNLFMAFVTVLMTPLVLSFASPLALGLVMTVASCGTLVGGIVVAVWGGPTKDRVRTIFGLLAYCCVLLLMAGFQPNTTLIASGAFFFVLVFPIIAASVKVIWQSRVPPDMQGRVFAMRSLIAGSTTPLALIVAGPLADEVFEPLMAVDGALAGSVGQIIGVGPGRGIGLLYVIFAFILMAVVFAAFRSKALMNLEEDLPEMLDEDPDTEEPYDAMAADAGLGAWRPFLGWSMAAVLAVVSVVSILASRPPAVDLAEQGTKATEVSIAAALEHVEAIAQEPHPLGSTAHQEVFEYLLAELESLGLEPVVQEQHVRSRVGRLAQLVTVKNVMARLPGTSGQRQGAVLVVAHYDSVPTSPGACDNGTAVGVALEAIRAMQASGPLLRDVIFLFSDAEETGLHGARVFVSEHPWARDVGVVLNFDARGHGGPVYMFQTGDENGGWLPHFASQAPRPIGSSLMNEIYRLLPNATDFLVFKAAGFSGFNFAYIDGLTHYHTMLDSYEDVEPATVAHQSTYIYDLARQFADMEVFPEKRPNRVFFNVLGFHMVHYPRWFAITSAVLTGLVVLWVLATGLRRGRLTFFGLGQGLVAFLGIFIALPVAITLVWMVVREAARVPVVGGSTEGAYFYMVSFACLALALFIRLYRFFRQAVGALDMAAGTMIWWLLFLVLTTEVSVPAESNFIVVWPLLFSALGLRALILGDPTRPPRWPTVLGLVLAATVAILLFVPLTGTVYVGLQSLVALGGFPLILEVLLLGLLMPQLETFVHRRPRWVLGAVTAIGFGFLAVGVWNPGADRALRLNSVIYAVDADSNQSHWYSFDLLPDSWTRQFGLRQSVWKRFNSFDPLTTYPMLHADAAKSELPVPEVEVLATSREGTLQEWTVRLETAPGATSRLIWFDPPSSILSLRLGDTNLSLDGNAGGLVIQRLPLPPGGEVMTLRGLAGNPSVKMVVVDTHEGLPEFPGLEGRPAGVIPRYRSTVLRSDISMVRRSFDLIAMAEELPSSDVEGEATEGAEGASGAPPDAAVGEAVDGGTAAEATPVAASP